MGIQQIIEAAERFEFSKEEEEKAERVRLAFIERFPEESLKDMQLEEYLAGNGNIDSYCYWLEKKIIQGRRISLNIADGGHEKFGIFSRGINKYYLKNQKKISKIQAEIEFKKIKQTVITALEHARSEHFDKIENLDTTLDNTVLLKILTIYYPDKFLHITHFQIIEFLKINFQIENRYPNNSFLLNILLKRYIESQGEFAKWSSTKLAVFLISLLNQPIILNRHERQSDNLIKFANQIILDYNRNQINEYLTIRTISDFVEIIAKALFFNGININDDRITFVTRLTRFGILICGRSFLSIVCRKNHLEFRVTTKHSIGNEYDQYNDSLYHNIIDLKTFYQLNLQDIIESCRKMLEYKGRKHENSNRYFCKAVEEYIKIKADTWSIQNRVGLIDKPILSEYNNISVYTNKPSKLAPPTTTHPLNQILYGPPGTGKTYNSVRIAAEIIKGDEKVEDYDVARSIFQEQLRKEIDDETKQIEFVTFHQNFSYEDFIQGLRPDTETGTGNLSFSKVDGVFKRIADRAGESPYRNFVIVIDEINRANISRVFGELITLIEEDKRIENDMEMYATLPSGDRFGVPKNLYLLGTMNTADKSLALIDIALRRRFDFVAMYPNSKLIDKKEARDILQNLNSKIIEKKNRDFQIGHSYFMNGAAKDIPGTMNKKVIPLLLEYFNNDAKAVEDVVKSGLNDKYVIKTDDPMIPVKVDKK